jgi:hypothetical protein
VLRGILQKEGGEVSVEAIATSWSGILFSEKMPDGNGIHFL